MLRKATIIAAPLALTLVFAQDVSAVEALNQAEISSFESQLERGRFLAERLDVQVTCLSTAEDDLQSLSSVLEIKSGNLRTQSDKLKTDVLGLQSEQKYYSLEVQSLQKAVRTLEKRIKRQEHKRAVAQRDLDDCKSTLKIEFLCDAAAELNGVNSAIRTSGGSLSALRNQVNSREKLLKNAELFLNSARNRLSQSTNDLNQLQHQIRRIDQEVSAIKSALGDVRSLQKSYSENLDTLVNALREYNSLDPNTDEVIVAAQVRTAGEEFDQAQKPVTVLLSRGGLTLPGGSEICVP